MTKLHITVGIPGCGKSTWAKQMVYWEMVHGIVCPDAIRKLLTGDISDQSKNGEVFSVAHTELLTGLQLGLNLIFDATNVTPKSRKELANIADKVDVGKIAHYFSIPFDICYARNFEREKPVPDNVMRNMEHNWLSYSGPMILEDEGWKVVIHV